MIAGEGMEGRWGLKKWSVGKRRNCLCIKVMQQFECQKRRSSVFSLSLILTPESPQFTHYLMIRGLYFIPRRL